ncbi:MAG: hypothetical protein K6U07_08765, partial [Firmicutes bacterium]|nr:hypothetical protein [Bacillota bacterium]
VEMFIIRLILWRFPVIIPPVLGIQHWLVVLVNRPLNEQVVRTIAIPVRRRTAIKVRAQPIYIYPRRRNRALYNVTTEGAARLAGTPRRASHR